MIIEAFVLSMLIGFIRGGRLYNLATAPFRHVYLFALSFVILGGVTALALAGMSQDWLPYIRVANVLQYALLLAAIVLNAHIRGIWIAGIGTFLNFLVVAANGGMMPVSARAFRMAGLSHMLEAGRASQFVRHVVMSPDAHLKPISDILPVPGFAIIQPQVASIGDLLVAVGVFVIIQRYMCVPVDKVAPVQS